MHAWYGAEDAATRGPVGEVRGVQLHNTPGPEGSRGSGGRRDAGGPHMVVVENPPTIDEKGKVISNMAVGVAEDLKS